ncbi:MAG: hypothetical protein AAF702_05385 [Chloroflexota bacterium]
MLKQITHSLLDYPRNKPKSVVHLYLFILFVGFTAAILLWQVGSLSAQQDGCETGQGIDETLSTGTRWELCWSVAEAEGILLHQIHITTPDGSRRQVLNEAGLAQIYTHYDDGETGYHYLSDVGLGGDRFISLTENDCPQGQLLQRDGQNVLCQQIIPRGYVYRHFLNQRQGEYLRLFSASDVGGPVYLVEWRFYDDGTIEPLLGDTGVLLHTSSDPADGRPLDSGSRFGIGYINNVYWRLDFGIGDSAVDTAVEELELLPMDNNRQRALNVTTFEVENKRNTFREQKRSWRVKLSTQNSDGHPISYQLEPRNLGHEYMGGESEPWTHHQLYVTVDKPCERLASRNPQEPSCGSHVDQFVNGESLTDADIVLWYGASSYRLIRDEDEPVKPTQWLSFQLIPRDWTAQNPLISAQFVNSPSVVESR